MSSKITRGPFHTTTYMMFTVSQWGPGGIISISSMNFGWMNIVDVLIHRQRRFIPELPIDAAVDGMDNRM